MTDAADSTYWLVGASYGRGPTRVDQTPRFLAEGIWENGYTDRYLDLVRQMKPGDRIAIKSAYVKKHGLPFDARGQSVSVMAIKAVGTIIENLGDGRRVKVAWDPFRDRREWYFYTWRRTIWRLNRESWLAEGLIDFVFHGKPQDFDRYRNSPFWRDRYGDHKPDDLYPWTAFYAEMASKLRAFRNRRADLLKAVQDIASRVAGMGHLDDQYADGTTAFLRDICPFTTMALFNRTITEANRKAIAQELADFLKVQTPLPESLDGIPLLPNLNSWFFAHERDRAPGDIDCLWDVFEAALDLVDVQEADAREEEVSEALEERFVAAFDAARQVSGVNWNLSMGLFWVRPWSFPSLDGTTRTYLKSLGVALPAKNADELGSGEQYLAFMEALEARFSDESFPVHSYPELALKAYLPAENAPDGPALLPDAPEPVAASRHIPAAYTLDDVVAEGCFVPRAELDAMRDLLRRKKNLILQGPPGTGKTWLAKRLAFALIGMRDETRVRALQFHPTMSYEDFVRGWRPDGKGGLSLVDGVFLQMVDAAKADPSRPFVLVIEEINRGNPAQIFGELLTLLEADKRTLEDALELAYPKYPGERVYVPENLFVIGTMNIADRSLALVDLALRRRFAFQTLQPRLNQAWQEWVVSRCTSDADVILTVSQRLRDLNKTISEDPALGKSFEIGHSFVTPSKSGAISDPRGWFREVVEAEIGPLLEEYWYDAPEKARAASGKLLEGF